MMPLTLRPVVRGLVSLAFLVLPLAACDADAQRTSASAPDGADEYRLTMPVVRKALAAMYAPGAKTACDTKGEEYRDVRRMSVAEMEKHLHACPPVRKAAAVQGIAIRELALVSKALTQAGYRMAEEASAQASGGTPPPLPEGALRDNIALIRQNEAELARLSPDSN